MFVLKRRLCPAIFVITFLTIAIHQGMWIGQAQVAPPPIDLSGKWVLDSGETIEIDHLASSGSVIASFSPSVKCHNDMRSRLLNGFLKGGPSAGGATGFTLTDGPFFACTRDKKLIDSCGVTAVWKSKFRDAKVSSDGDTITGQRFHEWIAYEEKDGRYVNCRRDASKDSWSDFTLTRACDPNKADKCRSLSQVMRAISQLIDTEFHTPTPAEWNQSVARIRPNIDSALDKLRKEFCDDQDAQAKIDEMKATLQVLGTGSAQTPSQVVGEQILVARMDLALKEMATTACATSGPSTPPPASGICRDGSPPKQPGDNEAIDQARKQIDDAIKEAMKMLQEYERDAAGGANTTAGKYADYWRARIGQLKKLKGYWDMIRSASCIPRELVDLIKAMLGGRTDMCTDLCYETAKWIETWYPGPNGDIQKKMFLELCGFNCP